MKITDIPVYTEGFDAYAVPEASPDTAARAMRLHSALPSALLPAPDDIEPDLHGNVVFKWKTPKGSAVLLVGPTGWGFESSSPFRVSSGHADPPSPVAVAAVIRDLYTILSLLPPD